MSGTSFDVKPQGFSEIQQRLLQISGADFSQLLDNVGALVESQTRRRIQEQKKGPDGTAWRQWSPAYAARRRGGHSLLQGEGHLMDSIQYLRSGTTVEVGTNLVYGAVHQHGHKGIPARPYLGLSSDDEAELVELIDDFVDRLVS